VRIEPEYSGFSIVLIGNFNPVIFNPDWLYRHELVSEEEFDSAKVNVIHPDICNFTLGKYIFDVNANQFSIATTIGPWVSVLDLMGRIFGEILIHTPVRQFGINRDIHFSVGSEAVRNKIGHMLAPIDVWGNFGAEIAKSEGDLRGGMVRLTMQQSDRHNGFDVKLNATVEPSSRIKGGTGIFVQMNNDWSLPEKSEDSTAKVIAQLGAAFEKSIQRSEGIVDHIMSLRERA
jgi:hypothetical protein